MILSETWFIEGYIDFELQKYKLLAYLKEVNGCFDQNKLYPQLSDTIFHYNNLTSFRENKRFLQDQFPKRLDSVNMQQLELLYEKMLEDDALMQELEDITQYAIAEMKNTIKNGAEIYEFVERQLHIAPIGMLPLYKNEGYMLLRDGQAQVKGYAYNITLFEHQAAKFQGIRMEYIDTWTVSISNTYEQIKRQIIQTYRALPNPAVYCVESPLTIPLDETLLPIAKRLLVRQINTEHAA